MPVWDCPNAFVLSKLTIFCKLKPVKRDSMVAVSIIVGLLLMVAGVLGLVLSRRPLNFPDTPEIAILHAGGGDHSLTYLNAQETFAPYYAAGYRYFEYDLRLSTDGHLIGTHDYEWFDDPTVMNGISYDAFKQLKICGGAYTPIQETWLLQTLQAYPDVKIVIDTKEDESTRVYERLSALAEMYQIDLSRCVIPQIYSREMWQYFQAHDDYDEYIYSNYKSNYTVNQIIKYFGSEPKITAVAVQYRTWAVFDMWRLRALGKNCFAFTPKTAAQIARLRGCHCNGFYVDDPSILA